MQAALSLSEPKPAQPPTTVFFSPVPTSQVLSSKQCFGGGRWKKGCLPSEMQPIDDLSQQHRPALVKKSTRGSSVLRGPQAGAFF